MLQWIRQIDMNDQFGPISTIDADFWPGARAIGYLGRDAVPCVRGAVSSFPQKERWHSLCCRSWFLLLWIMSSHAPSPPLLSRVVVSVVAIAGCTLSFAAQRVLDRRNRRKLNWQTRRNLRNACGGFARTNTALGRGAARNRLIPFEPGRV